MTGKDQSAFPNAEALGLTKREYFAALALQGLMASPSSEGMMFAQIASTAVRAADALIDALNQDPE